MNTTDRQLLGLLRATLWKSPVDASLFDEPADWDALFSLAEKQTVVGWVYDAVLTLPERLHPAAWILYSAHLQTIRTAQTHQLLNTTLAAIYSRLQSEGIRPVLLKGQGIAQNYPVPVRRACGDIDLYIGESDYARCCQLVNTWGMTDEETTESIQHLHFKWGGVTIELHRIAGVMYSRSRNRAFRRWSDALLTGENCRTMEVDGTTQPNDATQQNGTAEINSSSSILLPPVRFDSLYIFYHTYKHFLTGGIGLRQLCDWAMYLHTFSLFIDRRILMHDLKKFGLLRPWQAMGHIVVDHIGMPAHEFPFYDTPNKYRSVADSMLDMILQNGNFGFYNPCRRVARPEGYLAGKMHTFRITHIHLKNVFQLCPHDAWRYYKMFLFNGVSQVVSDLFTTKNKKKTIL